MTMRMDRRGGAGTGFDRAVLGLAALLAVAGCATPGGPAQTTTRTAAATAAPKPNYTFTITFAGACPVSAEGDAKNCPDHRPDCLHVNGGETVNFVSSPPGTEFVLSFDPFVASAISSSGGSVALTAAMHGNHKSKPYTFIVTAKSGCDGKPLDPQIILE